MKTKPMLNSFNGGELSPLLDSRIDIEKYHSGCRILENMITRPQGAADRRPGTIFVARTKFADKKARLIPFIFSDEQAYMLEVGEGYIRFYFDRAPVHIDRRLSLVSRPGDRGNILAPAFYIGRYEITTPYTESDLFDVQHVQSADVMYQAVAAYLPKKLSRYAHNNWLFQSVDFTDGPFLDENDTDITLQTAAVSGSGIAMNAKLNSIAVSYFTEDMVGSLFKLKHIKEETSLNGSFTANGTSSELVVTGLWDFTTHGNWGGKIIIQRKYPEDTDWAPYRTYTSHWDSGNSTGDRNIQASGTEDQDDAIYRIKMEAFEGGECSYDMSSFDYMHSGIVRVVEFVSGSQVKVDILTQPAKTTATKRWSQGAWNEKNGYPGAICFYQERLGFAGSNLKPVTLWLSKSDDYERMASGVNDNDAIVFNLSVAKQNRIKWMEDTKKLLLGTSGSEHTIGPASDGEPLTATNVRAERNDTRGSVNMQPVLINNAAIFLQKNRRILSEFVYSWESDNFVTSDLTVLAEHITESGIVDMAFQRRPDPILWCVRADGVLAAMTYMRDQGVVAWHRHNFVQTGGCVESVAVIPGTDEDQVWVSVKRTINGQTVRYIEYFSVREFGADQSDCHFVDCAAVWPERGTAVIQTVENAPSVTCYPILDFAGDYWELIRIAGDHVSEFINQEYPSGAPDGLLAQNGAEFAGTYTICYDRSGEGAVYVPTDSPTEIFGTNGDGTIVTGAGTWIYVTTYNNGEKYAQPWGCIMPAEGQSPL
jgi:hypothetical protein